MKAIADRLGIIRQSPHFNKTSAAGMMVVLAAVGVFIIFRSHAATPFVSIEPELGTVTPPASIVADANASGGKYAQFGAGTVTPPLKPLTPGTSWDWILSGNPTTVHLDNSTNPKKMMDYDPWAAGASHIAGLKSKGIVVICYFSAGTYEPGRSDSSLLAPYKLNVVSGYPEEYWLNIKNPTVIGSGATQSLKTIMENRIVQAQNWGCDGIEPDNIDGYDGNISSSYGITAADQITYNKMLATSAHAHNMSIGLKNDVAQINDLASSFDWALNEQCNQYSECGGYSTFISQNKAVFNAEYQGTPSTFCPVMNSANIDSVLYALNLDGTKYQTCR